MRHILTIFTLLAATSAHAEFAKPKVTITFRLNNAVPTITQECRLGPSTDTEQAIAYRIHWPDGRVQTFVNMNGNSESLKLSTSCQWFRVE